MPTRPALALLLALGLSGCVAHPGGVAGWRELRSPNFRLQTDLPQARAQAVAQDLEGLHATIRDTFFAGLPPEPRPLTVVAFASPLDYQRHSPSREIAAYFGTTSHGQDVIVMPATWAHLQRTMIAHELTHHLAHRAFQRQPTWFAEGLATYMESLAPADRREAPTLGGVPSHVAFRLKRGLAVSEVLVYRGLSAFGYAEAWALVHFLANTEPTRLDAFMGRLAEGRDPDQAWRAIFPEWDPADAAGQARLDRAVNAYLEGGAFSYGPAPTHPPIPLEERLLPPAEVRELRFSLLWRNEDDPIHRRERAQEVEEALAEDPDHLGALWALADLEPKQLAALGARAVKAHPDDERAWLLVARGLPKDDRAGRERALRRAVEASPGSPRALMMLAAELLGTGRSGEALPLARRATVEAPRSWVAFGMLSAALEDLGRCEQAVAAQERSLAALWERAPSAQRKALQDRLDTLSARCGAAPQAP